MNVFVVGLPAKILVGFAVIAASLPFVADQIQGALADCRSPRRSRRWRG